MGRNAARWFAQQVIDWLVNEEPEPQGMHLCNYDLLRQSIKPCDVVLVEGLSRISEVIKTITQSPWSHAVLYLGAPSRIKDTSILKIIHTHYQGDPDEQLIVEALMDHGTVISPLKKYSGYHLRICRPAGLSEWDANRAIWTALQNLGKPYDVRQILDLARFLFPYAVVPRRWRSSLFQSNAGETTRTVCSSMLAEAFMAVNYPIVPVIQKDTDGNLRLFRRNFRLFTPRDFDNSPYFEIVKHPLVGHENLSDYRNLPWDLEGWVCNAEGDCFRPAVEEPRAVARPQPFTPQALWLTLSSPVRRLRRFLYRLSGWPFSLPTWGIGKHQPTPSLGPAGFAASLDERGQPLQPLDAERR